MVGSGVRLGGGVRLETIAKRGVRVVMGLNRRVILFLWGRNGVKL